jgi:murein L,D-transpeptidase YafK
MEVRHSRRWPLVICGGLGGVLAGLAVAVAAPDRKDGGPQPPAGQIVSPNPSTPAPFSVADRDRRLGEKGMTAGSPVMIRIFKAESELELWLLKDGRFELFATYPICFWSGKLGPKQREGDRQAPEGFYSVGTEQLHLKGRQPRSLHLGFPNALDRAHARTGSHILVHGGCQSIGCYAMTNPVMEEIFALSEQALHQGQDRIPVHAFPFRMTEDNLKNFADHPWYGFWLNLKDAYDVFERTRVPPRVGVCDKKYLVSEGAAPGESAVPAGTSAWNALSDCERDEAEAALWQAPTTAGPTVHAAKVRTAGFRHRSRHYGRNARKAYAAARRSRVASHARRYANH